MSMRLSEFVWQKNMSEEDKFFHDFVGPYISDLSKFLTSQPGWMKGPSATDPEEYPIPKDHDLTSKTWDMIHECLPEFMSTKSWPWYYDNLASKDYCLKQYTKDEDYTDIHIDTDTKETYNRMVAWVLFLNDVEEGGEFEFLHSELKVKPEKGKVLMFPCNYLFPYRVNTPKSNDLTIMTGYIYNDF